MAESLVARYEYRLTKDIEIDGKRYRAGQVVTVDGETCRAIEQQRAGRLVGLRGLQYSGGVRINR